MGLDDLYEHWSGSALDEHAKPKLLRAAQTHADGYLRGGLVKPSGLEGGTLAPIVDRARGFDALTTVYLAESQDEPSDSSTARLVGPLELEDLPTYGLTGAGLAPQVRVLIDDLSQEGFRFFEVSGLANSRGGPSRGGLEIFRAIIRDTIIGGTHGPAIVYCSLVESVRTSLARIAAPANFSPSGPSTTLPETEERPETELTPVVISTDHFVANLRAAAASASNRVRTRRYAELGDFFASVFPDDHLPPSSAAPLSLAYASDEAKAGVDA